MLLAQGIQAIPAKPDECKAFRPRTLANYIYKQSDLAPFISPKTGADAYEQGGTNTRVYWTVYSDRSNNPCYEDSQGQTTCGTLSFEEELRIAEIENGRALVYVEPDNRMRYPQISGEAKVKGWVPMDHLLLWSLCPTNDRFIYQKALIVANMDQIKSDPDFSFSFTNPQTKEGRTTLKSRMGFLYVMKTDQQTKKVLLAKESVVGGKIKVFYGWVSPGTYIEWNDRTCLELNWVNKDREQLREAGITSIPVKDAKTGQSITNVELGGKNHVTNIEKDVWRQDPAVLRFPLLKANPNDYVATIFADTKNGGNSSMNSMGKAAEAQKDVNKTVDNMRIVNIIVVIDGTKGMDNCYSYVQRAIERAYKDFSTSADRVVRVGGVIYRDYGYKMGNRQCTYEVFPMMAMNGNDAKLKRFFSGGDFGIKNAPTDKDDYVALFGGIDKALDAQAMNYNRENSNLMFVIGNCGNRANDTRSPSQEVIVKKLVDNRIQLSSFQVKNMDTNETNLFQRQMGIIVRDNMLKQYQKHFGPQATGKYRDVEDGSDFVPMSSLEKEHTFFIGGYRYPDPNMDLNEARLYSLLKSTAERFDKAMSRQIDMVTNAEDVVNSGDIFGQSYLKSFLGPEKYKLLEENQYMMAKIGNVPHKSSQGIDFWRPVIYISHREFRKLTEGLSIVYKGIDNSTNLRHDYVTAMKELVRAMLPGYTESQMGAMSNEEIMEQISGLTYKTSSMKRYSLTDIMDEGKVPDNQFMGIVSSFVDKYRNLISIRDKNYPFSTKHGSEVYYWIPADDLP